MWLAGAKRYPGPRNRGKRQGEHASTGSAAGLPTPLTSTSPEAEGLEFHAPARSQERALARPRCNATRREIDIQIELYSMVLYLPTRVCGYHGTSTTEDTESRRRLPRVAGYMHTIRRKKKDNETPHCPACRHEPGCIVRCVDVPPPAPLAALNGSRCDNRPARESASALQARPQLCVRTDSRGVRGWRVEGRERPDAAAGLSAPPPHSSTRGSRRPTHGTWRPTSRPCGANSLTAWRAARW